MCMALYFASKIELPTGKWVEGEIFFYLEKDDREILGKHLSLPYKYYCGSHGGCSCGFSYKFDDPDITPDEEDEKSRQSAKELFEFLKTHIKKTDYFEIYSCREGEEAHPKEFEWTLNLAVFELGESFWFDKNELIRVIHHPVSAKEIEGQERLALVQSLRGLAGTRCTRGIRRKESDS